MSEVVDLANVRVGDPQTIKVLEDALAAAKRGEIVAIGLVGNGRLNTLSLTGPPQFWASLNVGLDHLKYVIREQMFQPKQGGNILVPR